MITLKVEATSQRVLDYCKTNGINVPTTFDTEAPEVPDDLTDLSDEDVLSLYNLFVEYGNFMAMQTTIAEIELTEKDKHLKFLEAQATANAAKGETATKTKALLLQDSEFQAKMDDRDFFAAYTLVLKTLQKNVSEQTWVVKSDLQRRKSSSFRPYTA